MHFPDDLIEGRLVQRYKRFLADVELVSGETITVHCPNSGSMKGCSEPGRPVLISDSKNPKRKLRHTLEMIQMGSTWVGVNTLNPNRAVAGWIEQDLIPELAGYPELRREVPYGQDNRSRIDLLLEDTALEDPGGDHPRCWVEIKNTTWRVGEHSAFPDAVTKRGQKHLEELAGVVENGERGVIFFFVGRADCTRFRPADEIDPDYGRILRRVVDLGVEALAYRMRFTRQRIELKERVPVDL